MPHLLSGRRTVLVFWILAFAAIAAWVAFDQTGWDVGVYRKAIYSLQAGHDPYADAMAIQRLVHAHPELGTAGSPPYSYVYSPITLPLLRLIGILPLWLSGSGYWLLYIAGVLAQIWFGMRFVEASERPYFVYLAPAAAFFPGLLVNGIVLGGNIAYILYPLMLLAALAGWRRGKWSWFYLAVLAASCVKAPLLSLAAIPLFSARRQWIPAGATAAAGIALFVTQPLLWPTLFHHYLEAVELQFSFNRDFGSSPAGIFSDLLYSRGIPYSPASLIFYLLYAIPLFASLVYLSRRFLRGDFALQQWVPVLLVGMILFNPRIIEYDAAPLTIPLALIGWRLFRSFAHTPRRTIVGFALFFGVANGIALTSWDVWKLTECPLLLLFFAAGSWNLLKQSTAHSAKEGVLIPGGFTATRKRSAYSITVAEDNAGTLVEQ